MDEPLLSSLSQLQDCDSAWDCPPLPIPCTVSLFDSTPLVVDLCSTIDRDASCRVLAPKPDQVSCCHTKIFAEPSTSEPSTSEPSTSEPSTSDMFLSHTLYSKYVLVLLALTRILF